MYNLNQYTKGLDIIDKLKKENWYNIIEGEDGAPSILINLSRVRGLSQEIKDRINKSKFETIGLICVCEFLKNGPKVVLPSLENCFALENVKIKIDYKDIYLPFPSLAFEFPYKYFESLKKRFNCSIPTSVLLFQKKELDFLAMTFVTSGGGAWSTVMLNNFDTKGTVEEHLDFVKIVSEGFEKEEEMIKILQRVLINYCLLLTNYGHEEKGIIDRKGKVGSRRELKEGEMIYIGMKQSIKKLYTVKTYEEKGGTHTSPHPHWRDGHWKNQPYGEKRSKRKQIFIKPVFVRADRFGGEMGTTSVEYH